MSALARPALCVQLLLLSAGAGAFCVTPLSQRSVRCLATERQALGMNAGADSPIPELAALYEVMPLMTYDGWECDAEIVEDLWVSGRTSESIKERVEEMRRKQRVHDSHKKSPTMKPPAIPAVWGRLLSAYFQAGLLYFCLLLSCHVV